MIKKELFGVCAKSVQYSIDEQGLVHDLAFNGGCDGNQKAVGRLVEGRPVAEVAEILSGISCGRKSTSCADQFAQRLKEEF